MRVKTLLPAAVLALALAACAPAESQATPSPAPSPSPAPVPAESQVPEETAAPELVWTDQIFAKDFTADDGTVVMSVEEATLTVNWETTSVSSICRFRV